MNVNEELTSAVHLEEAPVSTMENGAEIGENIPQLSRQGYAFLKQELTNEAIVCFRKILDLEPENNYALVGIGDAYRKKKRFQESAHYYQKCLKTHDSNNYALFGLADCYRSLKQYHRAIEVWETYLALDDQNVTVLTRIADAYRKVQNLEKSASMYEQVLIIEPGNPYALIGLAHLYYDFHDYEKAMDYWLKMVGIAGKSVDIRVLTSLGNCHRKMRTYENGIRWFESALEREPENFYALFGLGDCYRGMNQPEKSLEYWKDILANDPENKVILTRSGDAWRKLGLYDDAKECYLKALNQAFDPYAILGLAIIHKEEGKIPEATKSLEKLLEHDPSLLRPYPDLMDCYLKLGERHKATSLWDQFKKLKEHSSPFIETRMESLIASLA